MATKAEGLGDRMKSYETTEIVSPNLPFIVRADGKTFSTYTRGLNKPFDDRFQQAMVKTANGLLEFFNAKTVFVCSDEITLIFSKVPQQEDHPEKEDTKAMDDNTKATDDKTKFEKSQDNDKEVYKHIFGGRRFKIETLVAAKASVLFNKFMNEVIQDVPLLEKVRRSDAIFDARLIVFGEGREFEIVNNLLWRSCYECHRNTVSTYGRFHLGTKATFKQDSQAMIKMMAEKGVSWDEIPMSYRYGVFAKRVLKEFNDGTNTYTRTRIVNFTFSIKDNSDVLELLLSKYLEDDQIEKINGYQFFTLPT